MNIIKSNKRLIGDNDYINELTKEMDKYSIQDTNECYSTYIINRKRNNNTFAIRFPGATIGYILIDCNGIIKDIKIYDDSLELFYKPDVVNNIKKYIGYKLEMI